MTSNRWIISLSTLLVATAILVGGCAQQEANNGKQAAENKNVKNDGHNLHGYWCSEHGVPEADCSLCSAEKAKEFKAEGDWCKLHDRAKSQCFKCDPKLYDRFAAMYKAKYGKEPPRPPVEEFAK